MMSPQRGFTRRGDGWWSGRSRGSSSAAAFALAGRRRPKTGWRLFSLPAPTSCSIWRFSDRVLVSPGEYRAWLFDLDGVITDTASVHAAAWKRTFDGYLKGVSRREGTPFEPFE